MTDVVGGAWERIERWMAVHTPPSFALLAPPATDLSALTATLGYEVPPELAASLRRHDGLTGWANLFPEASPISAARIAAHYEMCLDILDDVEPGPGEPWWHPLWVPFAESNGDALVIDLRPGPGHGRLGMAIHDAGGDFSDGYRSLGAFLTAIADALEHGGPVGSWHPYLTADNELWWSLAGETTLHGRPLTPHSGPR
ncbi:SMI1/KNR4 family protein [Catenuloplanes japonicus]|uniref:SMI1/KNR4 family protein n=1 Tax=Catenuloplanes japonicus TaxID=33876 RepID=UPI000526DBEE|nr:SMI1/KNR4 family protein [Catenuloplanes japonicus]